MDNGSSKLRFSRASDPQKSYVECLNTVAYGRRNSEVRIGAKLDGVVNESLYRYTNPHTRGILTNFDTQMQI